MRTSPQRLPSIRHCSTAVAWLVATNELASCRRIAFRALGFCFESCRPNFEHASALVAFETFLCDLIGHCLRSFQGRVEVLAAIAILPFLAALVVGAREAEEASRNS